MKWLKAGLFAAAVVAIPAIAQQVTNSGVSVASIAGLGTGVLAALQVAVGSVGSFVVNGGALGTPSSGTGTNITGIPSSNILGTVTNDNAAPGVLGEYISVAPQLSTGTATVTAASPAVVTVATWAGGGGSSPAAGCTPTTGASCVQPVYFTNSGGALPTGITANTNYYIDPATYSGNTFQISDTAAHAAAGTNHINTSSTGTGTHTAHNAVFLGTGATSTLGAVSLTAGDWTCDSLVLFSPGSGTTVSQETIVLSTSQTAISVVNAPLGSYTANGSAVAASANSTLLVGPRRITLTGTLPFYVNANATFAVSTLEASGLLSCRRMR